MGVKWNVMRWLWSRKKAWRLGMDLRTPLLAFLAQARLIDMTVAGDQADHAFGEMNVEVVGDDGPAACLRAGGDGLLEEASEVFFVAGVADLPDDLSRGDVEGGDQRLGAVAAVFELAALDPARRHRQVWGDALKCLNAGHLVDRDRAVAGCAGLQRLSVSPADRRAFFIERRVRLGRQPEADAVRLEV